MRNIIISQRLDKVGPHKELRNNLDLRFVKMIQELGFFPIIFPNNLKNALKSIKRFNPKAIILSAGGDPLKRDSRYQTEKKLISYSIKKKIPIIGFCRGAQFINIYFCGKISKVRNHVRTKNKISGIITENKDVYVNSYHDYGIKTKDLGKNLKIMAIANDNSIECFVHKTKKVMGIMWHPERYRALRKFEKKIIKNFIKWN